MPGLSRRHPTDPVQPIHSILAIADKYDTIVFDQWGVLHNGKAPYVEAIATIADLHTHGLELAVLSNSGKRASVNRQRITGMGFPAEGFEVVMTSGEALAIDIGAGQLSDIRSLFAITASPQDAENWAEALPVAFTEDLAAADAVLLMGLPDAADHPEERLVLNRAGAMEKRLICSNPDRASPRADGVTVQSPGALAHAYRDAGGDVVFYGKPHRAIFDVLFDQIAASDPARVLMVGDSPEHDIAGAAAAGWDSLFIAGGLHADATGDLFEGHARPTYTLPTLR